MISSAFEFAQNPFSVTFRPCTREPGDWKEEVSRAAFSLVRQAGNRPIVVCFSGGIDSEVLCHALFEQGVNFSTLTIADSKGSNEHDVLFATEWCRSHNISQKIVRLDYEDFYKNSIERYISENYLAVNSFRYFQIYLLEQVQSMGGFAVVAGGEPRLNVKDGTQGLEPCIRLTTAITLPLLWMQRNNAKHQPFFYSSSPELMLSYLRTPIVDTVLRHPEMLKSKSNRYMLKRFVQHAYWPNIQSNRKYDDTSKLGQQRFQKEKELLARFEKQIDILNPSVNAIRIQLEENLKR